MIFVVHPDKSVTTICENVNVGDTATKLIVVSPFSGIQTVSLHYVLPNGEECEPAFATYAEGYPLGDGYIGNVYVMNIPPNMTNISGTVKALIVFTDTKAQRFVSDTITFDVGGFVTLPFPSTEEQGADFAAHLEALAAAVSSAIEEAQALRNESEDLRNEAKQHSITNVSLDANMGLRFTFADGHEVTTPSVQGPRGFTGSVGPRGADGKDGADGKTPVISVAEEEGGHRVTMTLDTSVTEFFISDGRQGEKGDGLYFDKVYTSVAEMEAGFATDGVQLGRFVIVSTEDVNDEDNSKFFVKTVTGYRFVNDLSGAIGIQGPRGLTGPVGPRGASGARGSRWFFGNADPTGYISGAQYGDWYLNTATGVAFEYDMSAWAPRVSLRGPQGAQGVSPTIAVNDTGTGYQVTVTDKNGTKSFQLLHGKDGEGGEGGGSDPRRSTLLCDAVLGWQHYGEGNYEMYAEMPLADTILPNTAYIVNGQQITSDGDGRIEQEVAMSYGLRGIVYLSGKTVRLEILSEYDPYDECVARVTVVGPGAFTCIAQLTALGALGGEGWNDVGTETTVDALSLIPYRLVYLVRENGTTHTAVLDGDGNLPTVNVNTTNKPLYVSITDGKLTVNGKYFTRAERGVTLTVLAETLDVGDGGSAVPDNSSSAASAEVVYAPQNSYLTWRIPTSGTYLVKIEGTSNANRWIVLEDGYVKHDSNPDNSYGISVNVEDNGLLWIYPESQSIYLKFEQIGHFRISCFIEGTSVLLRDPSTMELYEKPIEQVLPFEYAAFWNPAKGRLDATRVLAPPIAGDAEEFDRLYFDNGTELDVYGVQFFWNVDTDTLVDWAKMEQGTRVCTKDGDIVRFVRSEHIVPDAPMKHYTLLTYRGRYIAGGIVAGDKRDLIYPRLMAPERVRYWRMLNETDQNGLIKAHREGCRRRNWRYSRELHDALDPLKRRRRELEGRIGELKQFLADTDHRVIKFTEGVIDEAAFAPDRTRRAEARTDINRDEVEIVTVDGQIAAETERVRAEIAATWKPKYAGRFVGKNKVILEDEV